MISKRFENMNFVVDHHERLGGIGTDGDCECTENNRDCLLNDAIYYSDKTGMQKGPWTADAVRVVKAIEREVAKERCLVPCGSSATYKKTDNN